MQLIHLHFKSKRKSCHLRRKSSVSTFEQDADNFDVVFVHQGFSTGVVPSLRRAIQPPFPSLFPAALFAAADHGRINSSAQRTQRRTTFTLRH